MQLSALKISIDFGLVVLIWITQLITYPSFLHCSKEKLVDWHKAYTQRIAHIVGPLMLAQLIVSLLEICNMLTAFNTANLVIILLIWGLTLVQFVPRHKAIAKGRANEKLLLELVRYNWARTFLWTILFVLGAYKHLYN